MPMYMVTYIVITLFIKKHRLMVQLKVSLVHLYQLVTKVV